MVEETTDTVKTEVDSPTMTEEAPKAPRAKPKKKARRMVNKGRVYVLASFNNTIVTVTDEQGNVLVSASAGSSGFRGSKKGTAYAAQVAAEKAIGTAKDNFGLAQAEVSVNGVGLGREAAIRTLINQKIQVESIRDVTGIPHGGVRPRKSKRN
jgi:small subunit ribosomal protein S11